MQGKIATDRSTPSVRNRKSRFGGYLLQGIQPSKRLVDRCQRKLQHEVYLPRDRHMNSILWFSTGFDSVTGGIIQIDIRGLEEGVSRRSGEGILLTISAMTTAGLPNLFFMYGPQGPTYCGYGLRE
ncbi:hypothetical protein L218DRAFT_165810 [Marasmius fiardii PR-910]|nr:hypothetical protein L218DRAFT_165810 [Marasmius fiardii PR-910]